MTKKIKSLLFAFALSGLSSIASQTPVVPEDTTSRTLDEVVVTAAREFHKGDHDVILLSAENKQFGSNALSAISSLNRFTTKLSASELLSWDGQKVFILLNGVPSTAMELKAFKGEDIQKIEYYQITPAQYAGFTSGPVVNVILKRRHDRYYTGYFDGDNAVNTGYGTNQVSFTYRDSLNQVTLNDNIFNRNNTGIEQGSLYRYSPILATGYFGTRHDKELNNTFVSSYQRYQGSHLFNAKLTWIHNNGSENESRVGEVIDADESYSGAGSSLLKNNVNTLAADLYYHYTFANGNMVYVNAVNSFGRTDSKSARSLFMPVQYEDMSYDVESELRNRTYSLKTNATFVTPMRPVGMFVASATYNFNRMHQTSMTDNSVQSIHSTDIRGSWIKSTKYCTIYPQAGVNVSDQITPTASSTSAAPYGRLYFDIWPGGSLKGTSLQLTLTGSRTNPTLGQLADGRTYIDRQFIATGNPDLNPAWKFLGNLSLCYFAPSGGDKLIVRYVPTYIHHPIVSVITPGADLTVMAPGNLAHSISHRFDFDATWRLVKWLELSPYLEVYNWSYSTPSKTVSDTYLRVGGTVAMMLNQWSVELAANSPTKDYDGDLISRGSAQFYVGAKYNIANWTLGASWHYFGHKDLKEGNARQFSYSQTTHMPKYQRMLSFMASYSFSVGRSRRHQNRQITTNEFDNGLNRYNKVGAD
ncbi:MAG: outer membrane beta-barrel protein [Bacteroides sp.]|nr:outer membrane beta-barrel protein [Bacteroides sp.]